MSQKTKILSLVAFLFLLLIAPPTNAKVATDFDPTLDFSNYKTFAYLGGTEKLLRMQLSPDQLNNQIHRSVVRELTAKGLREVQSESHPDLVVRYWIETQSESGVGYDASWGIYGTYWTGHWSVQYISMHTHTANEGTNRKLGANFDASCFRHSALWNSTESRIEMQPRECRA
jgi:hypothetical protein